MRSIKICITLLRINMDENSNFQTTFSESFLTEFVVILYMPKTSAFDSQSHTDRRTDNENLYIKPSHFYFIKKAQKGIVICDALQSDKSSKCRRNVGEDESEKSIACQNTVIFKLCLYRSNNPNLLSAYWFTLKYCQCSGGA